MCSGWNGPRATNQTQIIWETKRKFRGVRARFRVQFLSTTAPYHLKKGPIRMWLRADALTPFVPTIHCGFGLPLLEYQIKSQWMVGPHGVYKPVCGPHVNRPLSWDDEVGPVWSNVETVRVPTFSVFFVRAHPTWQGCACDWKTNRGSTGSTVFENCPKLSFDQMSSQQSLSRTKQRGFDKVLVVEKSYFPVVVGVWYELQHAPNVLTSK